MAPFNQIHTDTSNAADGADLALALFGTLGSGLPHLHSLDEQAAELAARFPTREQRLLKVIELCGEPVTAKQQYAAAWAYSWLGAQYREKTMQCASLYLQGRGWSGYQTGAFVEDGIRIDRASAMRASIHALLAQAQDAACQTEAALSNFMDAFRLEPYNAMHVIKAADIIEKARSREEALSFLKGVKSSVSYTPVKYTDMQGQRRVNDTFKRLIDAHILKLQDRK